MPTGGRKRGEDGGCRSCRAGSRGRGAPVGGGPLWEQEDRGEEQAPGRALQSRDAETAVGCCRAGPGPAPGGRLGRQSRDEQQPHGPADEAYPSEDGGVGDRLTQEGPDSVHAGGGGRQSAAEGVEEPGDAGDDDQQGNGGQECFEALTGHGTAPSTAVAVAVPVTALDRIPIRSSTCMSTT